MNLEMLIFVRKMFFVTKNWRKIDVKASFYAKNWREMS
jgi:hypothetical protein